MRADQHTEVAPATGELYDNVQAMLATEEVMACMCGDICCSSCGPAQGNWRCPICRAWASEGCEHIDDEGELKPEHQAEAERLAREENAMYDQLAKDLEAAEHDLDNSRRQEREETGK